MRTLTFARRPAELSAYASIGAHEVVTPLPAGPTARPSLGDFLAAGARALVDVWFVVDDVQGAPDLAAWDTEEGRALLAAHAPKLLVRRESTLHRLKALAPGLPLAIGPWPAAGIDDAALVALGVTRVWARPWQTTAEVRTLIERARRAGLEVVLPLPQSWQVRAWEADATLRRELFPLFDAPGTSWAMAFGGSVDVRTRCGELMELRTILWTKGVYKEDDRTALRDGTGELLPYSQTEGFPELYAENLRHPPAITPTPEGARAALHLDEPANWPYAPEYLWAYVHVPFCVRRCRFCFCASSPVHGEMKALVQDYVDTLCAEISMWADSALLCGRTFHTIYFGGGSPSALSAAQLARCVAHARAVLPMVAEPVVSVEMAPSSATPAKFAAIREAGANRVSFGLQSFSDRTLEMVGSAHTRVRALRAVERARAAGFVDIDTDLLYGAPGQSPEDFARDIEEGVAAGLTSFMLFPLHVAPDLLAWWVDRDVDCRPWSASRYHDFWDIADRTFERLGFTRFGYSHYKKTFAEGAPQPDRRGRYSRYLYVMPGTDGQIAFGPTALGCAAGRQYENLCGLNEYVERVKAGHLPVGRYTEPPTPRAEMLWLVVERSAHPGWIDYDELVERYGPGARAELDALLGPFVPRGLYEKVEGGYHMTRSGAMWMANVQYELLRRADLPAPLGHTIWE